MVCWVDLFEIHYNILYMTEKDTLLMRKAELETIASRLHSKQLCIKIFINSVYG